MFVSSKWTSFHLIDSDDDLYLTFLSDDLQCTFVFTFYHELESRPKYHKEFQPEWILIPVTVHCSISLNLINTRTLKKSCGSFATLHQNVKFQVFRSRIMKNDISLHLTTLFISYLEHSCSIWIIYLYDVFTSNKWTSLVWNVIIRQRALPAKFLRLICQTIA